MSPVPLSATTAVPPVGAFDVTVSEPLAAPAFCGSKFTCRVTAFPGFSVTGKPGPVIANPAPLTVAALTVSGAVPVERTVTNCGVACVFTVTSPKARLLALRLIAAVPPVCTGSSCRLKVAELVPSVAVMIAVCVVVTAAAVSVKFALLRLAPTATLAGTTAAESLLDRLTVPPLLPTAPLSVTTQLSVPAPVIVLLLQATAVTVGLTGGVTTVVPVPLRETVTLPEAASLTTVSIPAADPWAVGLNCRFSGNDPPAATVIGSAFWLVSEKNCPDTLICEMWTATVLWFWIVTALDADCPTVTSPKASAPVDAPSAPKAVAFDSMLPQPDSTKLATHNTAARIAAQPAPYFSEKVRRARRWLKFRELRTDAWTQPRVFPAGGIVSIECIYLTSCKTKKLSHFGPQSA